MKRTPQQIRQERAQVLSQAQQVRTQVEAAEGEPPAELITQFEGHMQRAAALEVEARRAESFAQLDEHIASGAQLEPRSTGPLLPHQEPGNERRYSLSKALREMADRRLSGLELETSQALSERSGLKPAGFFLPLDLPMPGARPQARAALDLTTGAGAISDVTVPRVIDFLRNRLLVMQLGATVLPNLSGNLLLPKQSAIANATWVAAQASLGESSPVIGQVPLSPKRVGTYVEYDKALLHQSDLAIEQFLWNDLTVAVATKIDQTALNGSGTGSEPEGIIPLVPAGNVVALGANGAAPTWAAVAQTEGRVDTSNALMGSLHYVTTPKGRTALKTTVKDAGSGRFIWDDQTNQVNSYPAHATNQMPANLTKGSGTNLSALLFGDFTSVLVGLWGGLDLMVNPFSKDIQDLVRVSIRQYADIQLRHEESFSVIKDMIAA